MGNVPFYGPKTTNNNAVMFDKTYPCHFIMINSANDGVFLGRYVFVNYDDNLLDKELSTTEWTTIWSALEEKYKIELKGNNTEITELKIINDTQTYVSTNDSDFQFYDLKFKTTSKGICYPKDLWYLIDLKGSSKTVSQDSTIWQKVKSSNGTETYIQVASWNGAAPKIEFVKIAPADMGNNIDTYEINDLNYQVPYSLGWELAEPTLNIDNNQYLTGTKVKQDTELSNSTIQWEETRKFELDAEGNPIAVHNYYKGNKLNGYTKENDTNTTDTKQLQLNIPAIGETIGHMNYRIYGLQADGETPKDWFNGEDNAPQSLNDAVGNIQDYADNAVETYLNSYEEAELENGNPIEGATIKAQDLINTHMNQSGQNYINTYLNSYEENELDDGEPIEGATIKAQDLVDAHMDEQDNGYSQGQVYVNNNMYNNGPRLISQYMSATKLGTGLSNGQSLMNTYLSNNNNENANKLIQDYFNTNDQGQILINNKMDTSGQDYINAYLNDDLDENNLTNAQELVNNHMNIINDNISNGQNYINEHMKQEGQEYINTYLNSYEEIELEDGSPVEGATIKAQDLINDYMNNNDTSLIGRYLQENNKEQELIDNYLNSYNHIYDEDGNIITEDTTIKAQDLIGNYLQEERGQQNLNNFVKEHFNQPVDENDITSITMGQQYAENYFNNKNFEQSDYKEQNEFLSSFIKNKPCGEILPYNGNLIIPMEIGNEVQSNKVETDYGDLWYYIKIADIKNDHKTTAMALSKYEYTLSVEGVEVTNNYSVDNEEIDKRIQKKYFENYSVCEIGTAGLDLIITEEAFRYIPYPEYNNNWAFDIPESGIYVCSEIISYTDTVYSESRKGNLYFNITTKKIQEKYMPENYASKTYVDEVLNNIAMTGGQVQADYAETDDTKASYIHNKPEIDTKVTEDSTNLISSGAVFEAIDNIEILPSPTYDTRKFKDIENVPSYNTQEVPDDIIEAEIEQYDNLDTPTYKAGIRYYKVANLPQDINLKEDVFNEISHFIERYTNKEIYITDNYNDYIMGQEAYIGIKQELYSRSVVYGIFLIKEKDAFFASAYYKATFPEPGIYFLYVLTNGNEYIPYIETLKFKGEYKKLDNDYLYIDETPIYESKNLITSNAVFKVKEELTTNIEQIKEEYLTQENFNKFKEENSNELTEQFDNLQEQIDNNVSDIKKNIEDINILNNKPYIEVVEQLPQTSDNNNIIALSNNLNEIPFEQIKIDIKLRNELMDNNGNIDLKKATIIKNVKIDNLFNMDFNDLDWTIQCGYDYIPPDFSYEMGKTKSGLIIMDKSLKNGVKVLFNDINNYDNYPQIELTHISYNEEQQQTQEIQYYGFDSSIAPEGPGWYKLQGDKYIPLQENDFSGLNFSEAYIFDYWAMADVEEYQEAVTANYFIQYPLTVAYTLSLFVKFDITEGFYKAFKNEDLLNVPIQWSSYNNVNNNNTNASNVLPEPTGLPDGTIPYVQNGQWTTIVLTFAEEGEF